MTDQEPTSNAPSAGGSAVVLLEKTIASRHKTFRPTELSDQTPAELHHKRSRAPAVPSVAEEYKDLPENDEIREQKESVLAMSSEKMKHRASKKSSKRSTSPEPIAMVPIEVDVQKVEIIPSATLPIPKPVEPTADITDSKEINDNDDSITEEITDLRNAESTHKEWSEEEAGGLPRAESRASRASRASRVSRVWRQLFCCGVPYEAPSEHNDTANGSQKCVPEIQGAEDNPQQRKLSSEINNEIITCTKQLKKKEITWTRSTYLDKVQLQSLNTRSVAWMLEQKASVGPCFKKTLPYGEPSGITICLPKKSVKSFNENIKPSKSEGISITVSKRCLDINAKLSSNYEMRIKRDRVILPRRETKLEITEGNCANFLDNLKGKLESWRGRIKHVLHM